jgi:YggT family protein
MLSQVLKLLIDVVFGLITYALLLRFFMQALRAPFRNPLGQATITLTDWVVKPLRRVIPGLRGYDWATLFAAWVFQALWLLAIFLVFSAGFDLASPRAVGYVALVALIKLLETAIWLLIAVVIVQAVLSWVAPDGPLSGLLNALTFPFLRPIRRLIPPLGGTLDLSPLIVIVLAQIALLAIPRLQQGAFALFF